MLPYDYNGTILAMKDQVGHCKDNKEKGWVCQLAYDWLVKSRGSTMDTEMERLFINIWTSKVAGHIEENEVHFFTI